MSPDQADELIEGLSPTLEEIAQRAGASGGRAIATEFASTVAPEIQNTIESIASNADDFAHNAGSSFAESFGKEFGDSFGQQLATESRAVAAIFADEIGTQLNTQLKDTSREIGDKAEEKFAEWLEAYFAAQARWRETEQDDKSLELLGQQLAETNARLAALEKQPDLLLSVITALIAAAVGTGTVLLATVAMVGKRREAAPPQQPDSGWTQVQKSIAELKFAILAGQQANQSTPTLAKTQ